MAVAPTPPRFDRAGVKWTNSIDEGTLSIMGFGVGTYDYPIEKGNSAGFAAILKVLSGNGIHDIYLKVSDVKFFYRDIRDDPRDYLAPDDTAIRAARDAEIIDFIKKVYDSPYDFNIYLYKRQRLQALTDSDPFETALANNYAPEFVSEMTSLIETAKVTLGADGKPIDAVIQGIMPIETNCNDMSETMYAAKYLIAQVNLGTQGWLASKTFLMPGAGMGMYFEGIDSATGADTFFDDLRRIVSRFAFVVKIMTVDPADADICSVGDISLTEWTTGGQTVDQYNHFLNYTMGLRKLDKYLWLPDSTTLVVRRSKYPRLANVLFWGDSGDGIGVIQNHANRAEAVRQILVKSHAPNGYGYAFDYSVDTADTVTGFQDKALFVTYAATPRPFRNTVDRGFGPVWEEHSDWLDTTITY